MEGATVLPAAAEDSSKLPPSATPGRNGRKQARLGGFFTLISEAEHSARKEDRLKAAKAEGPVVKRPVILSPAAARAKAAAYRARVRNDRQAVSSLRTELAHAKEAAQLGQVVLTVSSSTG